MRRREYYNKRLKVDFQNNKGKDQNSEESDENRI